MIFFYNQREKYVKNLILTNDILKKYIHISSEQF